MKNNLKDKINELGLIYYNINSENIDKKKTVFMELFQLLFLAFSDKSKLDTGDERFVNNIIKAIESYDVSKSNGMTFYNYTYGILLKRKKDYDKLKSNQKHISIDEQVETSEDKVNIIEKISDEKGVSVERKVESKYIFDLYIISLTSSILNFHSTYTGKANNLERRIWHHIFYTEDITNIMKNYGEIINIKHERDVFSAIDKDYLDYYMSKSCGTLSEIFKTKLKLYSEVVPERVTDNYEIEVPIPGDVSCNYLLIEKDYKAGKTARSNQFKIYNDLRLKIGRTKEIY